jgi:hypothetical protein
MWGPHNKASTGFLSRIRHWSLPAAGDSMGEAGRARERAEEEEGAKWREDGK